MSKPKSPPASLAAVSNVLLVEVPPRFIALCEASGTRPQATLRGMAAMVCGLRYQAKVGACFNGLCGRVSAFDATRSGLW